MCFPLPQVRVNYANPDMVGHTGDLKATIQACETCDAQVSSAVQRPTPVHPPLV